MCVEEDVLPVSGYRVPAGTQIIWSSYVMARTHFEEPLRFRPERWLAAADGGDGTASSSSVHPVFAFKHGPRTCLGMNFAYAEAAIVLVTLLKRYRFVVVDRNAVEVAEGITMRARHGMAVRVESRQ